MRDFYFRIMVLILIILSNSIKGQIVHYSQFFSSPMNLNPALTGIINGDWRFISNTRSQGLYFAEPLNTFSVSYDRSFKSDNSVIGAGFQYNYDFSSGISIPSNKAYLSMGSMIRVSEASYLGLGMQFGIVSRKLSYQYLSFPEQYDRDQGGFNSSLPLSENFDYSSSSYFDLNIGGLWNYQSDNYLGSVGMAVYHLNQPNDYFLDTNTKIQMRLNWHGSFKYTFNSGVFVLPQTYYTIQNKSSEFVIGSNFGVELKSNESGFNNVSVGAYFRDGFNREFESAIFLLGLGYHNWKTFVSFDFDMSGLKTTNIFTNAVELTFIYQRPSSLLKKITLPCLRY